MAYSSILAFVVVAGLPLIGWVLSGSRRDHSGQFFVFGSISYALAVAVYLFATDMSPSVRLLVVRLAVCIAILSLNEFVVRISKPRSSVPFVRWFVILMFVPAIALTEFTIGSWGTILHHLFLVTLQLVWLINIRSAMHKSESRGIWSMGLGVLVVLFANLSQVIFISSSGMPLVPSLSSLEGFLIFLSNILWVMFFSVGYWSYSLDVSRESEILATATSIAEIARRRAAEQMSQQLEELVRQRDQLIMRHSRFEALNNVGVFNAAVIHELSQPLQRILLNADFLADLDGRLNPKLDNVLAELVRDSRLTCEIIGTIRSLLSEVSVPDSVVLPGEALDVARPMLESQAKADKVDLVFKVASFESSEILKVSAVLLHRVILNLFANSLAALKKSATEGHAYQPQVRVTVDRQAVGIEKAFVLKIWDNGSGFPADFDPSFRSLVTLSSSGGMGLGLVIAKQILSMWGGSLYAGAARGGTEVCLSIPLSRAD